MNKSAVWRHEKGTGMQTTMSAKVEAAAVTSIALEEWGLFGPPLGEPLDSPMSTAGLRLWQSGDASIRTGLWECTEGRFRTHFDTGEGEVIWVANGTLTCVEDDGPTTQLVPGDVMLFPPGWSGEWRIEESLRKVLAGWTGGAGGAGQGSGPALMVPRLTPAEAAAMPLDEGTPFPPERTGGGSLGKRSRTLWRSDDGTIEMGIWEIDAGRFHARFHGNGELIRIVAGEVDCTGDDGSRFSLRPGDWMTIPRGWTGEWVMPSPLRKVYVTWEAR
jgi:uncharacterized cupin superfamily protein